jgi:transposase
MRYELTDDEWAAIKPMLPNKPRGVPRVNDRRVLNGIVWVLRSGHRGATCQQVRPLYHLLQSPRSLAAGGRLDQDHERSGWRP